MHLLSIKNTPEPRKSGRRKHFLQLNAPIRALYQNWEGNTKVADDRNAYEFPESYGRLSSNDSTRNFNVVFPLGWQISKVALNRLNTSLRENENIGVVNSIQECFVTEPKK